VIAKLVVVTAVLTHLDLYDNNIKDEGAIAISEGLKGNKCLEKLNLGSNRIGVKGGKALASALGTAVLMLKSINLTFNNIGTDGAVAIAEALKSGMGVLTTLNLGYNRLDGNAKIALTAANRGRAVPLDLKLND